MANTLSELTLAEVKDRQRRGFIFAAGRYQVIPQTLATFTNNNNENAKFDKQTQDNLVRWLIAGKPPLKMYIEGLPVGDENSALTSAMNLAAEIWAGLPVRTSVIRRGDNVQVPARSSYYGNVGVNPIRTMYSEPAKFAELEAAFRQARQQKSYTPVLNKIALAEVSTTNDSGYDVFNAGRNARGAGAYRSPNMTPEERLARINGSSTSSPPLVGGLHTQASTTASPAADPTAASSATPTTTPVDQAAITFGERQRYLQETYVDVFNSNGLPINSNLIRWDKFKNDAGTVLQTWVQTKAITSRADLAGEFALLQEITSVSAQAAAETDVVTNRVVSMTPAEQYALIGQALFEFFPDDMRNNMASNAGDGRLAIHPHAWRAPGKLAVTANLTIPGISGFRMGQIFWIGRSHEEYKKYGAFQLFGITETIDVNMGWTTQLYSRFNALPLRYITGVPSV